MEWKTKLENCQTVTDIIAMLMLAGIKGDSICCDSVLFIVERAVKNERNAGLEEAAKIAADNEMGGTDGCSCGSYIEQEIRERMKK